MVEVRGDLIGPNFRDSVGLLRGSNDERRRSSLGLRLFGACERRYRPALWVSVPSGNRGWAAYRDHAGGEK